MPSPSAKTLDALAQERILITGAGGSIGSALALRIAALRPRDLILMDGAENRLFDLQSALGAGTICGTPRFVLGSVLDRNLLDEVFDRYKPTLVFHAAACKHVPLLEEQPLAAIENNVFGTVAPTLAAERRNARLILLSTDKAVEPASIMGATKRIAERVVLRSGGTVVRLGNVLASSGSVAEVFAAQIAAGGPLTVTDPAARRYFLTRDEAVGLLLSASGTLRSVLYAPELNEQHFVADLARFLGLELAPGRVIELVFTVPRNGDKESEKLWSANERAERGEVTGLLSIRSQQSGGHELGRGLASLRAAVETRDLAAALAAVQLLVPEFRPSARLLARAEEHGSRAVR
jgi:FlaA1/EpsC-like NDP-sugar epimerase